MKFDEEQKRPAEDVRKKESKNKENEVKNDFGDRLPHIDFSSFIYSLAHSALIQLGEEPDPFTGARGINLHQAKETIDLISLLEEKTKGNLTKDEGALIKNLLFNLRMKYVELAKKSPAK
ncbi:MAG: DUF1844 domain-containing protein [Nitrospirae bacterium]|nr:DUF1844 domain-containing protein [Nitrospirota bacterium]